MLCKSAVPELWLHKYQQVLAGVEFYFLDEGRRLELIKVSPPGRLYLDY
jgi:hypothetical protein